MKKAKLETAKLAADLKAIEAEIEYAESIDRHSKASSQHGEWSLIKDEEGYDEFNKVDSATLWARQLDQEKEVQAATHQ